MSKITEYQDSLSPITSLENGSADERELYWLKNVYQGDHVPQLTLRAVLMGGFIGMFMSISNLYTTVKIGWSFGVAITASVISYVTWNALRVLSGRRLSPMSILENNCMQSTASSAGYSTGATLGTAFGALLLITGKHSSAPVLLAYVFITAVLGVFIAIPMKRQMINIEQLKFPTGIAAAETLRSLYSHGTEAIRKAYALLISLFMGALVGLLRTGEGMVLWLDRFHNHSGQWFRIPELIAFPTAWTGIKRGIIGGFGFEPSVLLIGAGLIVGLRVSLSMLAGSIFLYFVICPWLINRDIVLAASPSYVPSFHLLSDGSFMPIRWSLWGGTSIMVFSSLMTVALNWRIIAHAFMSLKKPKNIDLAPTNNIEVPIKWFIIGMMPITVGVILINWWAFQMSVLLSLVAVLLSFLLALVTCRAVGETDTAPTGAMGKVTQLLYSALAQGNTTINLMSAGTTSCAAASAADLLTDLKSGYLLGANARKQFIAQFLGVFFGTIAVVPAWFLMFPDAKTLESFNPPATNMWKAVAEVLTQGLVMVPISAQWAMIIGAALGMALPLFSALFPKASSYMPSAMGLGLSWVMPFQNCLSFAVGAIVGWLWLKLAKKNAQEFSIPIASGLIAGESLMAAMVAIAVAIPGAMKQIFQRMLG